MSLFTPVRFNLASAGLELAAFEEWLSDIGFAGEAVIVAEIRKHPNLICLLGPTAQIAAPNLIRWELPLQGIYRTDLALGNDARREFLLVEFEGADQHSLFGRRGTAQSRNWSAELEHGFGQVVDWGCLLADARNNALLHQNFGGEIRQSRFMVICGRDAGMNGPLERARLDYRRRNIRIEGISSQVLTYDEMVKSMRDNLELWKTLP